MRYPNIEAERARNGMTQTTLAVALGVSRKTISNWARNGRIPQAKLEQMSILFDCSADYLLGRSQERGV